MKGRHRPSGPKKEALFIVEGNRIKDITEGLNRLRENAEQASGRDMEALAGRWWGKKRTHSKKKLAIAFVSRSREELLAQIHSSMESLRISPEKRLCGNGDKPLHPFEGERIFFSPDPLSSKGKVAFVFPGSGNQ